MCGHDIILASPTIHDDADLGERIEDLTIEKFSTQAGAEALDMTVFPR